MPFLLLAMDFESKFPGGYGVCMCVCVWVGGCVSVTCGASGDGDLTVNSSESVAPRDTLALYVQQLLT
jgi:hypothetical protein